MRKPGEPRLAVLGAGPIGLEAALAARALGWSVTVYERGRVGEQIRRWGHVRMFTPFGMVSTAAGRAAARSALPGESLPAESACLTGAEYVDAYLERLAAAEPLAGCLKTGCEVLQIGRAGLSRGDAAGDPRRLTAPFRLLVREVKAERIESADAVLDATGTTGRPRWLGDGGIPAAGELAAASLTAYGPEDVLGARRNDYAGKCVLVVGAGSSAATVVCALADLAEAHHEGWVIWLARANRTTPLVRQPSDPLRQRERLAARANSLATRGDGNLEYHAACAIDALEPVAGGVRVIGRKAGKPASWEVERIVACTGYRADTALTAELWVDVAPIGVTPMRQPEPGYVVLGSKSHGRAAPFLLTAGFEQIPAALTLLAGSVPSRRAA